MLSRCSVHVFTIKCKEFHYEAFPELATDIIAVIIIFTT